MKRTHLALGMAITLMAAAAIAPAASISVNFGIVLNDANAVDPGETAVNLTGAESVGGGNWNNVLLKTTGTAGAPTTFTANTQGANSLTMIDNLGASAGTMTSSGAFYSNFANVSTPNQASTGEAGLFQSFLNLNSSEVVTISGLSSTFTSGGYRVYAFFDIGPVNRTYGVRLVGNGGASDRIYYTNDTTGDDSDDDNNGVIEWLQTTATTSGSAVTDANYAVYDGLTANSFTLSGTNDGRAVITGLQIVAVEPPPAGRIAFIDINAAKGVPAAPDAHGTYWNSTDTATDTVALVDTANAATGWTLNTQLLGSGGSGLSGALNNTSAPPSPYDIPQAYADSWYDNALGGGKGEFSFSGLLSSRPYELKLFGDRDGAGVDGTIAFTVGTVDGGPTFTIEPGVMLTLTATPDASGVITFTLDRGAATGTADLNLMSIREIPEPATLVLLAGGGLGGLVRRRRRA